jgi:protein-tyrosine phosphatase
VGDFPDSKLFREQHPDGIVICVLEQIASNTDGVNRFWVPILEEQEEFRDNVLNKIYRVNKLNKKLLMLTIHYYLINQKKVLVHCGAGIERSPLTVACYLAHYHEKSMDDAYKIIQEKRPQVEDRRNWL